MVRDESIHPSIEKMERWAVHAQRDSVTCVRKKKMSRMLWSSPLTPPFFVSAQKGAITLPDKWDALCAIASPPRRRSWFVRVTPPSITGVTAALKQTMEERRWPCGDWIYPVGLRSIVKSWKPGVIRFPSRRQSAPRADPMGWSGRGEA